MIGALLFFSLPFDMWEVSIMEFLIGFIVGAILGIGAMCLMAVIPGKEDYEEDEWEDMFKKGESNDKS